MTKNSKKFLVTNNPLVYEKYSNDMSVEYFDNDIESVFIIIRNYIHQGNKLLTHPLSGSVKPNENPYKSVLLEKGIDGTDMQSVIIIEQSITALNKFEKRTIQERHFRDMQSVDLSLISGAIK